MILTTLLRNISITTGLAISTMGLLAQEPGKVLEPAKVLETTQKIADKIIRETSFETKLVPLSFNGGI